MITPATGLCSSWINLLSPLTSSIGDLQKIKDTVYEFSAPHIDSVATGTLVIKNSDPAGPADITITKIELPKDSLFKLTSTLPTLPFSLHKSDSIVLTFMFTPPDTALRSTKLTVVTSCPEYFTYTLRGRGTEAIISAADITFGDLKPGVEQCNPLLITNLGTYPFKITGYSLDNRNNFKLDLDFVAQLPVTIAPGSKVQTEVCFHPQDYGTHSGRIEWQTDLTDQTKIKPFSLLEGKSTKEIIIGVQSDEKHERVFSAHWNGNSLIVSIPNNINEASFELFDLLGRKVTEWESRSIENSQSVLPIPKVSSGVYVLRMKSGLKQWSCMLISRTSY